MESAKLIGTTCLLKTEESFNQEKCLYELFLQETGIS